MGGRRVSVNDTLGLHYNSFGSTYHIALHAGKQAGLTCEKVFFFPDQPHLAPSAVRAFDLVRPDQSLSTGPEYDSASWLRQQTEVLESRM